MKKFTVSLLAMSAFAAFAGWEIEQPNDNCIILKNDSGPEIGKPKMRIFPMCGSNIWMQKEFDLTQLPPQWRNDFGGAALRIYAQIADQSVAVKKLSRLDGLTENVKIIVNGNEMIIPTGIGLFPTGMRWADIPINPSWIKGDKLNVKIHKMPSKTNNDYLYIGTDTTRKEGASKLSLNSGQSFHLSSKSIPGLEGEHMVRLVLFRNKQEITLDFAKNDTAKQLDLQKNAIIKNGLLQLDGINSAAVIKNSADMNVTERGFTIAGVMRMDDGKKNNDMLIAHKAKAWFLGRTGNQINFSFCTNGENWNNALFGSDFPDLGEWFHIAAVFEFINETAQGNVGYQLSLYLNGELAGRKMFLYAQPTHSPDPVIIGNGFEYYTFKGNISSLQFFSRGMNEGEVDNLFKKAERISKLPPGFVELSSQFKAAASQAAKLTQNNQQTKWLLSGLTRAAKTGYDQNKLTAIIKQNMAVFGTDAVDAKLAKLWNSKNTPFVIIPSGEAMLLVATGKSSGNSPVLGMYNAATGKDIFDGRATGWLLNFNGTQFHDRSNGIVYEASPVKFDNNGGSFKVVWKKGNDFECISNFKFIGQRLEQDLEVKNLNSAKMLTNVEFPRFYLRKLPGKKDQLVFPHYTGLLYDDPATSFGKTGIYPSCHSSMQFTAYFDNLQNGIYTAFEATDSAVKYQSVSGRSGTLEYKWSNPVALTKGGNSWKSAGNAVVQIYKGDWFEAGQIYKHFIETKAPWAVTELPRKDTPKWYRDNCLWVIASPDQLNSLEYLYDYFEIPYASWFCRWQHVDMGMDPKLSLKDKTVESVKRLKNKVFLHPYVNSRLYGYTEDYKYFVARTTHENFLKNGIIQQNGKPQTERYAEDFGIMCPGTKYWQKSLVDMAKVISDGKLNGCYWDQLPCSSPRMCYATNHGHAPGDPNSWAKGYQTMLKDLRSKYPQLGLDGEDNSEVYANTLDGFMIWRAGEVGHVPLFQSIYGGGRTQFTGRGFDAFGGFVGSYEATFAKLGEQFVWGEQIGWFHLFDIRWGTPRRLYAKKLAHLRKALLGYLNEADMLKQPAFAEKVPQMTATWGCVRTGQVTTDKVLSSAWKRLRDGRIVMLFTNTADETITVKPVTRYKGYNKIAILKEGEAEPRYIDLTKSGLPQVKLAPYSTEIWLVGKDFDRAEAAEIAKTTCKVASFKDSGKSIHFQKPQFQTNKLNASDGKWFTADDSSWLLYAFKEHHPSVGYTKASYASKEVQGNWILARDGGVVSYGEVDFGSKSPKYLEIQIAVDKNNAGGKIYMDDITGDHKPNDVLAEITTKYTGGFFTWKTVRVPIQQVTGKRLITFRFDKKDCNFRAWRVIY